MYFISSSPKPKDIRVIMIWNTEKQIVSFLDAETKGHLVFLLFDKWLGQLHNFLNFVSEIFVDWLIH